MQSRQSHSDLARHDPAVRPLAALQATILRFVEHPAWTEAAAVLKGQRVNSPYPLLHGTRLKLSEEALQQLFAELISTAIDAGVPGADRLEQRGAAPDSWMKDATHAAIIHDHVRLESLASELHVAPTFLATLAHLSSLPLLASCGNVAGERPPVSAWHHGYCPLCGDWPTLAEIRGLDKTRWLRCGRCSSGWQYRYQECVFCGTLDHKKLGYLAAETERESRRVITCMVCSGYIKTFTTVAPLSFEELLLRDLSSVELDIAAIESGFTRPPLPDTGLQFSLEAV